MIDVLDEVTTRWEFGVVWREDELEADELVLCKSKLDQTKCQKK